LPDTSEWGAVEVERFLGLLLDVQQVGRRGLQPVGHLVGSDAGGNFRIADDFEMLPIERADQVERISLQASVDPGRAADVENGVSLVSQPHAGVDRRQKAARPIGHAAADA